MIELILTVGLKRARNGGYYVGIFSDIKAHETKQDINI